MPKKTIGKIIISPCSLRSACSYELRGCLLIARLFGIIPVFSIHLSNIHYLRLATREEINPIRLIFDWTRFSQHQRSIRPTYVLQAKTGRRLLLKLENGNHFRLRQAIGRQLEENSKPHLHQGIAA